MTFYVRAGWRDGDAVLLDFRVQADEGVNVADWHNVIPVSRITKAAAILGHVDPADGWRDGWWSVDESLDVTDDLAAATEDIRRRGRGQPRLPPEHHAEVLRLAREARDTDVRNVRAYIADRLQRDGHRPSPSTVSTWLTNARKWDQERREATNDE